MTDKPTTSTFILEAIAGLIQDIAKANQAWPTVSVFRKNNHAAIGLTWDENSRIYQNDYEADDLTNILMSIPFQIIQSIFFNANSREIYSLPLDDKQPKTIFYINDVLHMNIRGDYFDSED
ncbi:hypothetical protein GTA51_19435 [Desulfovibrio aerotolerans]|uniref:Uncharacterized protein n=1 Tax=Solidesulfovibrio aerotolerans TaxID=295255 RepID=A0A7C9N4E7_9BACT|nr:hypothetical protein [Solidesulfovibrio aerotolerans]MYL85271.1 hypothetical protein [Solidesulfovibrio aerotolerans]